METHTLARRVRLELERDGAVMPSRLMLAVLALLAAVDAQPAGSCSSGPTAR